MHSQVLTDDERRNVESGWWFSQLSMPLRQAILAHGVARQVQDGTLISSGGEAAEEWCCVARGAVRVSSVSLAGKQVSLTYIEPGNWFGDISLFDGFPRKHNIHARGQTTLFVVRKSDFSALLSKHVELYDALLRLNCRRLRLMFDLVEDLNTKPLAARLAKQLLFLARRHGVQQGDELRIGLALAQEDIAQLLGASRQRVNQELKNFERQGAVRVEPTRLVVLSKDKLLAFSEQV